MNGVEEVHPDDPLGDGGVATDPIDRKRRRVGGQDRLRPDTLGNLGEGLLLDLEVLDNCLDDQIDALEAGVIEAG